MPMTVSLCYEDPAVLTRRIIRAGIRAWLAFHLLYFLQNGQIQKIPGVFLHTGDLNIYATVL